jgi:hypothetical protein
MKINFIKKSFYLKKYILKIHNSSILRIKFNLIYPNLKYANLYKY